MFKFDFQLDEDEIDAEASGTPSIFPPSSRSSESSKTEIKPCHHTTLDQLLATLPHTISYSPLSHPSLQAPLLRRDLFDARFQLISSNTPTSEYPAQLLPSEVATNGVRKGHDGGEEFVDAKTDLIPGLYEGGLKTWEGGVDLIEVFAGIGSSHSTGIDGEREVDGDKVGGGEKVVGNWVTGGRVLEVGCGTALPSAFLLRSLLASRNSSNSIEDTSTQQTTFHLQDYNLLVLSLVTLPNLILATLPYLPPTVLSPPDEEGDLETIVPDLTQPGSLDLTPELITAFKELLHAADVEFLFTYGDWSGFAQELQRREGYGLVMTAETIYSEDSVDSLLAVLKASSRTLQHERGGKLEVGLEESLGSLVVRDRDDWFSKGLGDGGETVILVAAKVLYFGVGGGIQSFLSLVEGTDGGWWVGVKDWVMGVGRKVVRIGW